MATLLVENLSFKYPGRVIFNDLSFKVSKSEFVHLKGSNGVGKTTLMSILAGYLEANSGNILIHIDKGEPQAHPIEYVASEYNGHFLKMSAYENLAFYNALATQSENKDIDNALEYWGLSNEYIKKHLVVEKFSTGMKRRLCLARLNISTAPLWILDEPILGIDKSGLYKFIELCKTHISKGGSVIIISHDISEFEGLITNTIDFDELVNSAEVK